MALGVLVLWLVSMAVFYIFFVLNSSGADSGR